MKTRRMFITKGGVGHDVMLKDTYFAKAGVGELIVDGTPFVIGGVSKPPLRERVPILGYREDGANMIFTWGANETLKDNPTVVIMGSSISVSQGLSSPNRIMDKLQAYFDTDWGGATIVNIGVPGIYSTTMLPTAQGGDADMNIDKALEYSPDIILYIGPTNDVPYNTPVSSGNNIEIIRSYAKERGVAEVFIHSPIPRGSYDATQQTELKDNNNEWAKRFPYPYFYVFDSILRDKTAGTDAAPVMTYYQGDATHLNSAGTTVQSDLMTAVLERELRPVTAFKQYIIERSADGSSWSTFDTVTDPQVIRKSYAFQAGHYRMRKQLVDGSYTEYSNIHQLASQKITQISFAGAVILSEPGWIDGTGANPHTNIRTITDPATGFSVTSIATAKWVAIGGGTTGASGTQSTPDTYVFPKNVYRDYWFTNGQYSTHPDNIQIGGLDPAKTYKIEVLASRAPTSSFTFTGFTFRDNVGSRAEIIINAVGNKTAIAEETSLVPTSGGIIYLTVARASTAPTTGDYAAFINAMRITEL